MVAFENSIMLNLWICICWAYLDMPHTHIKDVWASLVVPSLVCCLQNWLGLSALSWPHSYIYLFYSKSVIFYSRRLISPPEKRYDRMRLRSLDQRLCSCVTVGWSLLEDTGTGRSPDTHAVLSPSRIKPFLIRSCLSFKFYSLFWFPASAFAYISIKVIASCSRCCFSSSLCIIKQLSKPCAVTQFRWYCLYKIPEK